LCLLTSYTKGIGRAGVVLEEIDYYADAFCLFVSINYFWRMDQKRGKPLDDKLVEKLLLIALQSMETFDRAEQGDIINALSERRLRRYLIWTIQLMRAKIVDIVNKDLSARRAKVHHLLASRVVVQVQPLNGKPDSRGEVIIDLQNPKIGNTSPELFISIDSTLLRKSPSHVFNPLDIINLIREYKWLDLVEKFKVIFTDNKNFIVPK
jgi:hypothetical protein